MPHTTRQSTNGPASTGQDRLPPAWERLFRILIWYSLMMYLIEDIVMGTEHSHEGWAGFLWSERLVAVLFTVEYIMRWRHAGNRARYPFTGMAIIDLISVLPFYAGFIASESSLHMIRTLRILRLLKEFRYSRGLQLIMRGFDRVKDQLRALAFGLSVLLAVSTAAMYEAERGAQPEAFGSLLDSLWLTCVTVTTVGYGDMYPVTTAGRVICLLTFIAGVSLFATFTAVMGSAFVSIWEEDTST